MQDKTYLAKLILEKDYGCHYIKIRSSSFNTSRIDKLYQDTHIKNSNFKMDYGDLIDVVNFIRII